MRYEKHTKNTAQRRQSLCPQPLLEFGEPKVYPLARQSFLPRGSIALPSSSSLLTLDYSTNSSYSPSPPSRQTRPVPSWHCSHSRFVPPCPFPSHPPPTLHYLLSSCLPTLLGFEHFPPSSYYVAHTSSWNAPPQAHRDRLKPMLTFECARSVLQELILGSRVLRHAWV